MNFVWTFFLLLCAARGSFVGGYEQKAVQLNGASSDLIAFHKSLTVIDSEVPHEQDVVEYLKEFLEYHGLTVELQLVTEGRHNVYAYIGSTRDTRVLLTAHTDTAPDGYFEYYIVEDEIHARGACDAKGALAAQVFAFLELWHGGQIQEGDLSLLFVVGEEYNGIGMQKAVSDLGARWTNAAIFGEPTESKLSTGHKGNLRFEVEAWGLASHSGYPELGFSANEFLMRKIVSFLDKKLPYSDILGPSTVNVGTYTGGSAANIVPDYAKTEMYIRVAQDLDVIVSMVEEHFKTNHSDVKIIQLSEPQYLTYDVPGFELISCAYATDIPYFAPVNVKKYLFGPGSISVAHTHKEFVTIGALVNAVDAYKRLVLFNL